jgi:hypothetical protein
MKKALVIILSAILLLSVISCSNTNVKNTPEASTTAASTTKGEAPQSTTAPKEPSSTTDTPEEDTFYAGYARVNISPDLFPISMYGGNMATMIVDDLYATVIAVSDGETTALFITLDLQNAVDLIVNRALLSAQRNGVPRENVLVNVTHNHSGVHYTSINTYEGRRWLFKYCDAIEEGIETAINDLAPARAYINSVETPPLNHVRRYYMEDGSPYSICMPSTTLKYAKHESVADREMQVIKFTREGGKDIVMVNWQAHAAHAIGSFENGITADFIHNFRKGAETKYDVNFAYYQGACGNINFYSFVHGSKGYLSIGNTLADVLGDALTDMTEAKLGKISVQKLSYTATIEHSTDAVYDDAVAAYALLNEYKEKNGKEMSNNDLYDNYGFYSKQHISAILTRHNYGETFDIPISAISFGDIAFASTPYEMFDTNGMQVKNGSPFKMTFMCAYTNGNFGYVPSTDVHQNGGYEVYATLFVKGTGDDVAARLIEMLKEQYNTK